MNQSISIPTSVEFCWGCWCWLPFILPAADWVPVVQSKVRVVTTANTIAPGKHKGEFLHGPVYQRRSFANVHLAGV